MNQQLQDFARKTILDGLIQLPDDWQNRFKLMYGRRGGKRSVEDAKAMPITDVVAEVPEENLSWAMEQIEASLVKLLKREAKEAGR